MPTLADPNWLYSSTAQSAAAIVAIVGGFITSRLLGLSAERGSLQNELDAKQSKLRALQNQNDDLGDKLQRMKAWRRGLGRLSLLRYDEVFPDLASVLASNGDLEELDPRIVSNVYDGLRAKHQAVRAFVDTHKELITAEDDDLHQWLSKHGLSASELDKERLERAFRKVRDARREEKKSASQRLMESLSPHFTAMSLPFDRTPTVDPRDRIEDQRTSLTAQIELLQSEVDHLEERLAAFSYPTSMWWGLGILAYLAAGGIILPLALLPADIHHEAMKRAVLALFGSGILALFLYIAAQMVVLQKEPRDSWGSWLKRRF